MLSFTHDIRHYIPLSLIHIFGNQRLILIALAVAIGVVELSLIHI